MTFSKDQAIFFSDSPSSLRASLFLSSCELTVHLHHWRTEWREQGSLMSCLGVKLPPSLDSCALLSLWDLNTPARDQMHAWNCRALTTVKYLCNNYIIILKVRKALCIFSRALGEAKNKTGGRIIIIRRWQPTIEYIFLWFSHKISLPCPHASIKSMQVAPNFDWGLQS